MSARAKSPAKRGRPRSVEADHAIAAAVLQLMPKHGIGGLSIEAVAAEAGVGKATIYRRWKSKEDLVLDVLAAIRPQPMDVPDTGTFAGDIGALNKLQVSRLGTTALPKIMPRLLTEDDERFRRLVVERIIEPLRDLIKMLGQRAIDRGELRPDLDLETLADVIHGTVIYRLLLTGGDLRKTLGVPEQVAELLAAGISTTSAGRASARRRS